MPELPEVETVRRGLQPAMEGARFTHVEARRPDLRFPFPKNFVQRLEGQTVVGLGRRAKYLIADLSSGDALVMHLGMSGSFRVRRAGRDGSHGRRYHEREDASAHDHVLFELSSLAKRPKNVLLSSQKFLKTFGFQLGPWQEQMDEVLAEVKAMSGPARNELIGSARTLRDLISIDEVG